jgi:hypothetical protein
MQAVTIYDLKHPSGVAQIQTHSVDAAEMCERAPDRYVRTLPPGVKLGPLSGANRIIPGRVDFVPR